MNSGTKLLALCFALLMAVPIIFYMPPAFSQTESTELSPKVQKSNDLNSAYDSLQDAYKNFPQRAARAKADLDSFLSACG
jgi:flagellar biosynthesis protein FliP